MSFEEHTPEHMPESGQKAHDFLENVRPIWLAPSASCEQFLHHVRASLKSRVEKSMQAFEAKSAHQATQMAIINADEAFERAMALSVQLPTLSAHYRLFQYYRTHHPAHSRDFPEPDCS